MKPLAIDLFAGCGGWSEGCLAEGYHCIGFDIERHEYGDHKYPAQLVLQDVRTIHGRQFKDASLIVASPPCQEFSYMAMPWSRAKQIKRALLGEGDFPEGYTGSRTVGELTALFDACFRIQREASEAAGHHIPMIIENVRGAQLWVGRARGKFGSFFLWGDVPALLPIAGKSAKVPMPRGEDSLSVGFQQNVKLQMQADSGVKNPNFRFDGSGRSFKTAAVEHTGMKTTGMNWSDRSKTGQNFTRIAGRQREGVKGNGGGWFDDNDSPMRCGNSRSDSRKAASAMIAKIPFRLSSYIARVYKPT